MSAEKETGALLTKSHHTHYYFPDVEIYAFN